MSKGVDKTVTAWCWDAGATLKSFDGLPGKIMAEMRASIERRLLKKGIAVRWNNQEVGSELLIRVVAIDGGNQFLRWLLPFISPAIFEVEVQVGIGGSTAQQFHYTQRSHFGLFGGSAQTMLTLNAQRVANKIAGDVLRAVGR